MAASRSSAGVSPETATAFQPAARNASATSAACATETQNAMAGWRGACSA